MTEDIESLLSIEEKERCHRYVALRDFIKKRAEIVRMIDVRNGLLASLKQGFSLDEEEINAHIDMQIFNKKIEKSLNELKELEKLIPPGSWIPTET